MNKKYSIKENEFFENPETRVPICLCLDVSGSMRGKPINELNNGLRVFVDELKKDEIALYAADVCIVTYGNKDGESVQCISDFSGIEYKDDIPTLTASGVTPMGDAVNMSLDLLEKRKNEYKQAGMDYYQPWLVLMTDGRPYGDKDQNAVTNAQKRTTQMVNDKKLVVFPIAIGDEADMETLKKFSPKNPPLRLNGLNFSAFFQWLSASVSQTSQSFGEKVNLPPPTWSL